MPELPEVETVVRALQTQVTGRRLLDIKNYWPNHLVSFEPQEFRECISGATITGLKRRGKYIRFVLDVPESIIIHLKMTGQLLLQPSRSPMPDHVHTILLLSSDEEIRFRDVRKFGRVYLTDDTMEIFGLLGPEPLSSAFTPELLYNMLANRRRVLKPLLLDQRFIAGIGNIYADESLFLARLAPNRYSHALSRRESDDLHSGIYESLTRALDKRGATISDYRQPDGSRGEMQSEFNVYGRAGEPCPRCQGQVERVVLGGRSTFFCPSCQV